MYTLICSRIYTYLRFKEKKVCPCFFFLFSLIITNIFTKYISTSCPTGHSFVRPRSLYVPTSQSVTFNAMTVTITFLSLFPKVVLLSPTTDLSALISKPVPMDIYPFPGVGILISQHFIMDSLVFPASSFHLFKAHLPQEDFLNLERQMQSLSRQSSLHSSHFSQCKG